MRVEIVCTTVGERGARTGPRAVAPGNAERHFPTVETGGCLPKVPVEGQVWQMAAVGTGAAKRERLPSPPRQAKAPRVVSVVASVDCKVKAQPRGQPNTSRKVESTSESQLIEAKPGQTDSNTAPYAFRVRGCG